jgi:hypothetical protein
MRNFWPSVVFACLAGAIVPVQAKQYSIRVPHSCETISFEHAPDGPAQNLWRYAGSGTGFCANFYGLGFKTKAKLLGVRATWLIFAIHSDDGDFPPVVDSVAVQWPIRDGNLCLQYGTAADHTVHFFTWNSYEVIK